MSLQIWLPLDGNFNQQGIKKQDITVHGTNINNAGKIGECYNFDGVDDYIDYGPLTINSNGITLSIWYSHSSNKTWARLFELSTDLGNVAKYCIGVGLYSGSTPAIFGRQGSTTASPANVTLGSALVGGVWTHIAVTITPTVIKGYRDGQCVATINLNNTLCNKTYNYCYLGKSSWTSDQFLHGRINDFRLYDNALTDEEIALIAQGKIIHYPMIREHFNRAAYFNETISTAITNSWNGTMVRSSTHTATRINHFTYRINWTNGGSGKYYNGRCGGGLLLNGIKGPMQVSCNITSSVAIDFLCDICDRPGNIMNIPANSTTFYTTIISGISAHNTPTGAGGYNGFFDYAIKSDAVTGEVLIENLMINDLLMEYDISGFHNDANITGTLMGYNNGIRYNNFSYYDSSTTTYLTIPNKTLFSILYNKCFTISFWIKPNNNTGRRMIMGTDASFPLNIEFYSESANPIRLYFSGAPDWRTGITCPTNSFTHVIFVFTADSIKAYQNSVDINTYSGNITFPTSNTFGDGLIGSDSRKGQFFLNSQLSDFRIYATALSNTEIKKLYEMGRSN